MSRIAKIPIVIPNGVNVSIQDKIILIKGNNGELIYTFNDAVQVTYINNVLLFKTSARFPKNLAQAGTARSIINSMIIGVTQGFVKKLKLVGIGYRVTLEDNILCLFLGFSHPIFYKIPSGVKIECHSQTDIILKSANKQLIGQVAAILRSYRRPDPYKGKGIRYADEVIYTKETKKK